MIDTELAGLVCTRICHDLVGPAGAVVNGVDLIRELGAADTSDELTMVEQSALRTAALLKFHRMAFGNIGDSQAAITRGELRQQVEDVMAGPRLQLGWSAPDGPAVILPVARMACLMLLAGRALLGLGGSLRMMLPVEGSLPVAVIAKSQNVAVTGDQRRWLAGEPGPAPEPRQIEFALIGPAAAAAGARIELSEGDGQLAIRALPV